MKSLKHIVETIDKRKAPRLALIEVSTADGSHVEVLAPEATAKKFISEWRASDGAESSLITIMEANGVERKV